MSEKTPTDRRHDVRMLLLGFLLTSIVGGGLTFLAQELSRIRERDAERRHERRQAAERAVVSISELIDTRTYQMQRLHQAIDRRADTTRWVAAYDSVSELWHERLPANTRLICKYFGDSAAIKLQDISSDFTAVRNAHKLGDANRDSLTSLLRRSSFVWSSTLTDTLVASDDDDLAIGQRECRSVPAR